MTTPELVLLYDGECAFCDRTVQTVLRHDRVGTMKFAPLQGDFAAAVMDRHPWLKGLDSLVLVEGPGTDRERVRVHSAAALGVARYLGGWWTLLRPLWLVPRPLRDWGYRLFARNRYRLFGKADACRVPSPAVRARFL